MSARPEAASWLRVLDGLELSLTARSTAVGLSTFMRHGACSPSTATVARRTGHDRRTVQRGIRELVSRGLLIAEITKGGKWTNTYATTLPPELEGRLPTAAAENQGRHDAAGGARQDAAGGAAGGTRRGGTYAARTGLPSEDKQVASSPYGLAPPPYEECGGCGTVAELVERGIFCEACADLHTRGEPTPIEAAYAEAGA